MAAPRTIRVTTSAFGTGEPIPPRFTCQGDDVSFPILVADVPAAAQSLALVVDDPDAPGGTWTHWTAWNLPASTTLIPEAADLNRLGARQGTTSAGSIGYHGPCPPAGRHRYFTRVYALDATLDLAAGATRQEVDEAILDHVLAWGELMGTFARR